MQPEYIHTDCIKFCYLFSLPHKNVKTFRSAKATKKNHFILA